MLLPVVLLTGKELPVSSARIKFPTVKALRSTEFDAHCSAYGFSISNDWDPIYMDDFQTYSYPVYDAGVLQYQTNVQQVFLKNVNAYNVFAFAYRVTLSPLQPGRYWGIFGIGSHGNDWYARGLKTTIILRDNYELTDWAPENLPQNYSGSIGVSLGSDGYSISANVNFNYSELTVISRSNVALRRYETEYGISGTGDYASNSVKFYGFLTFISSSSVAWIDVSHTFRYYGNLLPTNVEDTKEYSY